MSESTFKCPKCSGEMVKGLVTDYSGDFHYPFYWIEGKLDYYHNSNSRRNTKKIVNSFQSLNNMESILDLRGRNAHIVRAFRCEKCGYLELYAV